MSKLLYQINARFVKIEDIGNVPEGERKNFHFMGEISGEELQGTLRGIDYALTYEGLVQAHIHEVLTTEQGEKISLERTGTQVQDENKDQVLLVGQGQAHTASERLAWLNEANLTWKAYINQTTISYTAEVYLV
jgi:hypothetical protein